MKSDNEFDRLIAVTSEIMDVPEKEILDKYSRVGGRARRFICHVIWNALVDLQSVYIERLGCTNASFHKNERDADMEIHTNVESLSMMNEIRRQFGLVSLRKAVKYRPVIPATKTLFGFVYTESDELLFRAHCRAAKEYMKKMCSYRRQPIADNGVFPRPPRRKPTYDSWYQD